MNARRVDKYTCTAAYLDLTYMHKPKIYWSKLHTYWHIILIAHVIHEVAHMCKMESTTAFDMPLNKFTTYLNMVSVLFLCFVFLLSVFQLLFLCHKKLFVRSPVRSELPRVQMEDIRANWLQETSIVGHDDHGAGPFLHRKVARKSCGRKMLSRLLFKRCENTNNSQPTWR